MNYEKLVLVTRKTRLEGLIARFNTKAQAKFYIEHSTGNFALYEREHEQYYTALAQLRRSLQGIIKIHEIERQFLPNYIFAANDLIMTIGIDGLVVNTAKYLNGQPIIAINPDPQHIDGVLLPFHVGEGPSAVHRVLNNQFQINPISMAQATLNDGQSLLAFNDLFIGRHDHISCRYQIKLGNKTESHSSSGIIVSTGAGATGWLSSLFNMANGMVTYFGDNKKKKIPSKTTTTKSNTSPPLRQPQLPRDAESLIFVVREPFISKTTAASLVCGQIKKKSPLIIESNMPEGGVIFSDGLADDYLEFNAGAQATIQLADQKTNLVINNQ
ncbi:MAG TPA: hypothetical protein VLL52_04055 [Anaerolineae bacterium]|nr:hypothetical protein [Anaerolineae bacterium]